MTIGEDVLNQSVTELGAKIKSHALSPVQLTEAYLARIAKYAPQLNCFQTVTADLARAQARAAEAEINGGNYRGPLHGIPYGVKDLLATKGIPTSWGAEQCKTQVFDDDATVITRLQKAGAVLLGKLAMVELAGGLGYSYGTASCSGPMRNPWNPARWTGGSSAGTGAAVAAGLVGFGIGTETWGSILCPSAFCNVTGLRPTFGRVSRAGAMALSWSYDKIGPMCRTSSDIRVVFDAIARVLPGVRVVFDAIAGQDARDPHTVAEPIDVRPGAGRALRAIKAALVTSDYTQKGAEPEHKLAFDSAVAELRAAGLNITEAQLPEYPASLVAGMIITAEALSAFEHFHTDGSVRQMHDRFAPHQWDINQAFTAADLNRAWRMRTEIQDKMTSFFTEYDVIIATNFLSIAPPVDTDMTADLAYADPVGAIGNTCGLPALALPCGFGKGHMPLGFQVMGAPYDEATLLTIGDVYQSRTAFHRERPPLA